MRGSTATWFVQDLVEALSKEKSWWTPRKANQQAYERKPDGSFKGFEEEVCQRSRLLHDRPSLTVHSAYKESFCTASACTRFRHSAPVANMHLISMSSVSSSIAHTLNMYLELCLIPSNIACTHYYTAAHNTQHGPFVQVPFAYHDGYLSVHFEVNKYQDIKLTPLQEEAVL